MEPQSGGRQSHARQICLPPLRGSMVVVSAMHGGSARPAGARSPPPEFHRPPWGLVCRWRKLAEVAVSLIAHDASRRLAAPRRSRTPSPQSAAVATAFTASWARLPLLLPLLLRLRLFRHGGLVVLYDDLPVEVKSVAIGTVSEREAFVNWLANSVRCFIKNGIYFFR